MAARVSEEVYNDRDNVIAWVILEDDVAVVDLSTLTRVKITVGTVTVDSATAPAGTIWWTDQTTYQGATVDVLKLLLGHSSLVPGNYSNVCLILYDSVATEGAVYTRNAKFKVFAACD